MSVVKQEHVEHAIADLRFEKWGKKTTVGMATLVNGFEIVEASSCVKEENYNEGIGRQIVTERLHQKIWELLGFQSQNEKAETPTEINDKAFDEDEDDS